MAGVTPSVGQIGSRRRRGRRWRRGCRTIGRDPLGSAHPFMHGNGDVDCSAGRNDERGQADQDRCKGLPPAQQDAPADHDRFVVPIKPAIFTDGEPIQIACDRLASCRIRTTGWRAHTGWQRTHDNRFAARSRKVQPRCAASVENPLTSSKNRITGEHDQDPAASEGPSRRGLWCAPLQLACIPSLLSDPAVCIKSGVPAASAFPVPATSAQSR